MTDYREIIRLHSLKFSNVAIANSLCCSRNTVSEVLKLAETHSLEWPIPETLTNRDIEHLFYPGRGNNEGRRLPDYEYVYNELAKPGVTLSLLWAEYCAKCEAEHTIPYQHSQFNYKPEAVKAFEKIEKQFNETHDDIHLTISSPNEAMTILKTRFIREDYPDIIAIGGDINYSNFLDADLFEDISGLDEVQTVKQAYLDMDKELEFIPKDGTYALPYVANAAGILYNKDLFEENGWKVPTTWQEFTTLCDEIKQSGTLPLYLGFKDTWTCLAPWNALAVGLTDSDTCNQVNMGNTTFARTYEILDNR